MKIKSKKVLGLKVSVIIIFCLFIHPRAFYAQDPDIPKELEGTKVVVEEALRDFEAQKQNEEDELREQLNFRLGQATENWLTAAEKEQEKQLGTVVGQDWDKQSRIAMILPVNYEYYLRGYNYSVVDSDIFKTESLSPTLKAVVTIKEELYAEKSHHSNVSDIKPYLYTVTNIYTLNFIYKNDEFILANSSVKMESMVNEISSQVRKEWLWQWL
jgi:hypothetical protein